MGQTMLMTRHRGVQQVDAVRAHACSSDSARDTARVKRRGDAKELMVEFLGRVEPIVHPPDGVSRCVVVVGGWCVVRASMRVCARRNILSCPSSFRHPPWHSPGLTSAPAKVPRVWLLHIRYVLGDKTPYGHDRTGSSERPSHGAVGIPAPVASGRAP
jgi:hypothetical protein